MFEAKKCRALIHLSIFLITLMGLASCFGSLGTPAEVTSSGSTVSIHPHIGVWSKCIEYGAYTSQNNTSILEIVSTNPLYCFMGTSSNEFKVSNNSLLLNLSDTKPAFIGSRVNFTEEQFRTQLLGGGFGVWCI